MFNFKFLTIADEFGSYAIKYLEQISRIQRLAFTVEDVYTADYLGRIFKNLGYDTSFEEILFPKNAKLNFIQGEYVSHNIVATKKGESDLEVIIGAAYDSEEVKGSTGFEGATGVSVILDIATRLKDVSLPYTLKFVLFGAGKAGNIGSTHYVSTRSQDEIDKIMYFLNLSSLGSGEELNIYSNNGQKGFLREDYLKLSEDLNINLSTSPEIKEGSIPYGVGYDLGEHVAFKYSNIPFGFMEATSWKSFDSKFYLPDDPTGEGAGLIEGTSYDNYKDVMETFKDRVKKNISNASKLIYNSLIKKDKSIKIINFISSENLKKDETVSYVLFRDGKKIRTINVKGNGVAEFQGLEEGEYRIEVNAPENFKFLKSINDFKFKFMEDTNGEFVIVNDEEETFTYRKGFTDNYISIREESQKEGFKVGIKKAIFDYSSLSNEGQQDDSNFDKNDGIIKILSILLGVLIVLYILCRIIFTIINKKY